MLNVVILGTGNVAKHLFDAFSFSEKVQVIQVYGRNLKSLQYFGDKVRTTSDLNSIVDADICLLAISDSSIAEIAEQLSLKSGKLGILAHTSGGVPLKDLPKDARRGVFYPLQTFTKGKDVDFRDIPICIESESRSDLEVLQQLAASISEYTFVLSSQQREALHVAAVFVNNFSNHMYLKAQQICEQNEVPFEVLHPLLKETSNKAIEISPFEAQTGPARRGDKITIGRHIDRLGNKRLKKIYALLSESIENTYGEKL